MTTRKARQLQGAKDQLAAYKAIGDSIQALLSEHRSGVLIETLEIELARMDSLCDEFEDEVKYLEGQQGS